MKSDKKKAASQFATRAALGLLGWAMSGEERIGWEMPGPRSGESFAQWSQRASVELAALSRKARDMGQANRAWRKVAAGLAKGLMVGYPLALALGWCFARGDAAEVEAMDQLRGSAWELELWSRGKELSGAMARTRAARLDPSLPLPLLFGGAAEKGGALWAKSGKTLAILSLAIPLAPLGWGAWLGALPRLRASGWGAVSEALAHAAGMMGSEKMEEGPAGPERVFEGWLDASQWIGWMGANLGPSTLRAMESYEATAGGRKLGLLREPKLGWARMGKLLTAASAGGSEERWRRVREASLSKESGLALAMWGSDRSEDGQHGEESADMEEPREMATLAARWWSASNEREAGGERVARRVGKAVSAAFLEPGALRTAREAKWRLMGGHGARRSRRIERIGSDAVDMWRSLEVAAGRARRQALNEGWDPALANEVGIELVAAGLEVAWAGWRGRSVTSAFGSEWAWTQAEALGFLVAEQDHAFAVADAAGMDGSGLETALSRAMESGFSSGRAFFEAVSLADSKELLARGFAHWEARSLEALGS